MKSLFLGLLLAGAAAQAEMQLPYETLDGDFVSLEETLSTIGPEDAYRHLEAFQQIANASDNNRSAGTRGYDLSAEYVSQLLLQAGYTVQQNNFDFEKFEKISSGLANTTASSPVSYVEGEDYEVMTYSGTGTASGAGIAVDWTLGPDNASTSGCEVDDFKGFPAGNIAIVQRGACAFKDKAKNAELAGASAIIIFNQGNNDERKKVFMGTLGNDASMNIPVLAVSYDLGVSLKAQRINLSAVTNIKPMTSYNIIADHPSGNDNNIVMLGAHLDSVPEGPGINDNGSGSAAILEAALKLKNVSLNNKLRFAWWGAEELGLVGSTKYVEGLADDEKSRIKAYLNFDMVASPNYMLGVFDADGSAFGLKGPVGSNSIEKMFQMFYQGNGAGSVDVEFSGRSDYAAFADAGIPVGGIFTGAEGKKTAEEALMFGGVAGVSYDPFYHAERDDLLNLSIEALEINTRAISFMALKYGHSVTDIEKEQNEARKAAEAEAIAKAEAEANGEEVPTEPTFVPFSQMIVQAQSEHRHSHSQCHSDAYIVVK